MSSKQEQKRIQIRARETGKLLLTSPLIAAMPMKKTNTITKQRPQMFPLPLDPPGAADSKMDDSSVLIHDPGGFF